MNRGLLLTLTEPPAGMDEEFNAWYDDEHRYLATYELDSVAVLASAAYLQRFQNPSERIVVCELSDPPTQTSEGIVYRLYQP